MFSLKSHILPVSPAFKTWLETDLSHHVAGARSLLLWVYQVSSLQVSVLAGPPPTTLWFLFVPLLFLLAMLGLCCRVASGVPALGLSCTMWELSSLTRDQTQTPCTGSAVLVTGPPGKSPVPLFFLQFYHFIATNPSPSTLVHTCSVR